VGTAREIQVGTETDTGRYREREKDTVRYRERDTGRYRKRERYR
jgi:hypothetical protein